MLPKFQPNHTPDVLSCLASLSSDEVFTSPSLANEILDLLPGELWADPTVTILDPGCKSGVFLREAARRFMSGLAEQLPDVQERADHILSKQLFGLGITGLTAQLARRSLYCSRKANGRYSVATVFENSEGNIRFRGGLHEWEGDRCKHCGANLQEYDRGPDLESHAYEFIHTNVPQEIFTMQFDVIVSNPPYQLGAHGTNRDIPIYNRFVEQAKRLNPRYITMIIPSRWMTSGLGLTEFRRAMLADRRITRLVDYPVASEVFPGVEVKGGVCYFLWEREADSDCAVTTVRGSERVGPVSRRLGEFDVFVRDSRAISILHKVLRKKEPSIMDMLSVDKEFGWTSNFDGYHRAQKPGDVRIYYIGRAKRSMGWISRSRIGKSPELVDRWKVMVPKAYGAGEAIPHQILGQPFVAPKPSVCTQSYLFFYVGSKVAAESVESYVRTRFFRFLVSLRKITQDATRSTYTWVPQQDWKRKWTDEDLYVKYGISRSETAYIETMVRPMQGGDAIELPIGDGDEN